MFLRAFDDHENRARQDDIAVIVAAAVIAKVTFVYDQHVSGASEYLCYTDGSCKAGADAPGGWGFFIKSPNGAPIEGSGSATKTLAKTMEYRAVAEALTALPIGVNAIVFSDNQSLIENMTKHLETWRTRDFAKVDPQIVDSVRRIGNCITLKSLSLRWQWVRSHNGNVGNERADALATKAAREAKGLLATSATRKGADRGKM